MPRRLGQHFLNSLHIAKRIVEFAEINNESVIEIGAGKGMLTREIAKRAKIVYAIEIDQKYAEMLRDKSLPNVQVINADFLETDLSLYKGSIVIGNIPYGITTRIVEKLAQEKEYFKKAVLTLQKEYGERILARPGSTNYSSITCYANYYFKVLKGFSIKPKFFTPAPRVDSLVVCLVPHKPPFFLNDELQFFNFIKGLFRYRRKTLKNALIHHLGYLPEELNGEILSRRPQELELEEFYKLYCKTEVRI
ncbi:MAG: 16S rRNA (adenine(1518)-N(6)/adenine(1519)-N(6))-dimethyltransferase RsmA [candidate division WOR-3 bacterium]|nr:16S rRNA (adenine(1518)-N(6)/adenine(1519)-N(6))-dimethyltransferase RsmA [candidate division WOR-3 bacterium]